MYRLRNCRVGFGFSEEHYACALLQSENIPSKKRHYPWNSVKFTRSPFAIKFWPEFFLNKKYPTPPKVPEKLHENTFCVKWKTGSRCGRSRAASPNERESLTPSLETHTGFLRERSGKEARRLGIFYEKGFWKAGWFGTSITWKHLSERATTARRG